jgi:two-component system sensor histidine kinase BarA
MMKDFIKILVVEDDEVDRMAVRRALKTAGIPVEITVAVDCKSAMETLASANVSTTSNQKDFECALLDYRLPDGDGLTLVREIRNTGSKIPLIVLTGQGDEELAVELMRSGASDYLAKSKLSPENLGRSLRNAVRIYRAETEAQKATQRLRDSEERYRLVLEGSNDGIWDWDLVTQEIYCNDRLYEITGLSPTEVTVSYDLFCQLLHPEDRLTVSQALGDHLQNNIELEVEFRLLHTSGEYRYCIARGKAWRDASGRPFRVSGIVSDITDRKRAEEALRFLAEASARLSASLDWEKTLQTLAQVSVPFLADLCIVDIVENETVRRMGIAHVEPAQEDMVRQLLERYPPNLNSGHPVMRVISSGVTQVHEVSDQVLQQAAQDEEHLQTLREMNFKSYMTLPLLVRGRILGAISFLSNQKERRYASPQLAIAEELVRRAALSIENGKLYRETQKTSDNLREAIVILGEQQQQLRTLQQLTNLLNQRLTDLPGLLREIVGAVLGAIDKAEFCLIILNNPKREGMLLTVSAGVGVEKLRTEDAFSPPEGLLSEVFLTGQSQLLEGNNCQSKYLEETPAAIYAVAIESVQNGRLGVLAIGNWQEVGTFDDEDKMLLFAVAEQATIAIDNARMIKALEEQEERLEKQNEMLAAQNQELESQRQQLELQNLQLLEASRLKTQFLATMSHELRTPMNSVIGFSQLLLRPSNSNPLTPKQADMMERILSNGKHLLALIDDILDLSKIETGRLELKLETLNLVSLVRATTEEVRTLAQEKNLELQFLGEIENPNIINDSLRLRQIMVNLLSNAIKFTDTGSVDVEVTEISPDQLRISVKDTGIGISEENLKNIFDEFWQIDQTLAKRYAGTGLGLAITKSLVQLMQGKITVESQLGQGSTFCVLLPREVKISPQVANATAKLPTQLGANKSDNSASGRTLQGSRTGRMLY